MQKPRKSRLLRLIVAKSCGVFLLCTAANANANANANSTARLTGSSNYNSEIVVTANTQSKVNKAINNSQSPKLQSLPAPLSSDAKDESARYDAKLLPEDVLKNSALRFPQILESLARRQAVGADALIADGAFDVVFNAEGYDRVTGFWTGSILKTEARRNFRNNGGQFYGGYRISDGTFPIYEDINFTNTLGEFKIGALFSLLRDRKFDARRFKIKDADLAFTQANLDVLLTKVGVQQKALKAYWTWVAAGQELSIYQELLKIAQDREAGLEEQVRQGAQPKIAVTENLQNIIRREIFVAQAQRHFALASNNLSFYLRDTHQGLITPDLDNLPNEAQIKTITKFDTITPLNSNAILSQRPELRRLRVAIERAENKIKLSQNNLKPRLDLNVELSRDFGSIAEGGISRDSTDTVIGFKFSVPLERRQARGHLQRAKAELRGAKLREQQIEDQIAIELENVLTDLITAQRLSLLAEQDVTQAKLMVEAERKRFKLGASDFFLVNLREERAVDAQIRATRATLNDRLAQVSYNAATLNIAALGLKDKNNL